MVYITGDTHGDFSRLYGIKFNKNEFIPKYFSNGYEIIRDYCKQQDIERNGYLYCPKCDSDDIVILKGNGQNIKFLDEIGVMCNDCAKVYGFSNVQYYSGRPREL